MRRTSWIAAVVLVLVGFVWIAQGSGLLRGSSFMVGDSTWAVIGAVLVALGFTIAAVLMRHRSRA